ncbi:MAG: LytR/AlgR family response regulator transcription factor [Methylophagaceae bacterium]
MSLFFTNINRFFSQPFLMWEDTPTRKILFIGLFTFLSTVLIVIYDIYEPLQLNQLEGPSLSFRLVHAFVNLITFTLYYVALPWLFQEKPKGAKHTIGGEIIWLSILIFLNSLGHQFANIFFETIDIPLSLSISMTMKTGLFPIAIHLFFAQIRKVKYNPPNQLLEISATIGHEKTKIFLKDLLYIKALDNYCEVYFIVDGKTKKKILRVSLSSLLTEQLNSEYVIRSHRSYIVNLFNLERIEINSKVNKIYLKDHDTPVPLSQGRKEEFLNKLNKLPLPYYS